MSDDLFKDCDCGGCDCGDCDCGDCGDCDDCDDCDCDCCDCDCSCDDCLPANNLIIICCCIPPASSNNDPDRTNRSSDCFPCCCCCKRPTYSPGRHRRRKRRKKKGFCCWRLWCCCAPKDQTLPPSPPHPDPNELYRRGYMRDGGYPILDDLGMPMPRRGYESRGRYPMPPEEMRMYRDEFYGRGGRWMEDEEMRKDYYGRDRWDKREARGMGPRRYREDEKMKSSMEMDAYSREREIWAKREGIRLDPKDDRFHHKRDKPDELDIGSMDYESDEKYSSYEEIYMPTRHLHLGERPSSSEELGKPRGDHRSRDKPDSDRDHRLRGEWSKPVQY